MRATSDMAHPYGYAFFMALMMCVFAVIVVSALVGSHFNERETAILSFGVVIGGFVCAWLLGAFDAEYGFAAAGGCGLGLLGMGFLLLRDGGKNG